MNNLYAKINGMITKSIIQKQKKSFVSVLIVGGSSSLGKNLIDHLLSAGIYVYATSRSRQKESPQISWLKLDLSSKRSCKKFVNNLKNINFDKAVLLVGEVFDDREDPKLSKVSKYFETYISSYSWIINKIIKSSKQNNPHIMYMSSRSAVHGSWNEYYAAAKSAISLFIKSKNKHGVGTLCITAGLIQGSEMYNTFTKKEIKDHCHRAGGNLVSVEEVSKELLKILANDSEIWDGRNINIGPDYS